VARLRLAAILAGATALAAAAAGCEPATPLIEATTRLEPTPDQIGPYVVQSIVIGAEGDLVQLYYLIDEQGLYFPLRMDRDGERFSAGIPGQPSGTAISYFVAVVRDGQRVVSDPEAGGANPYRFAIE
jgi:hypothetical protein